MGIRLSWTDPNVAEDGYNVYRHTSSIAGLETAAELAPYLIAELPAGTTGYDDGGALDDEVYYYRVATLAGGQVYPGDELVITASGAFVPLDGLLAYWKFDENGGTTAADASGNGHDGTLTSSALWTPDGVVGAGIEGDGTNYVELGYGTNLLGLPDDEWAYAVWVYMPIGVLTEVVFDWGVQASGSAAQNVGAELYIEDRHPRFRIEQHEPNGVDGAGGRGRWTATGATLGDGWNLVIAQRDMAGAEAYVYHAGGNSSDSVSATLTAFDKWGNRNNFIGGLQYSGTDNTPSAVLAAGARIDIALVYGRKLSSTERDALWNDGNGVQ
ncbi:hypothetical protein PRZ61_12200 [Halomonas pacifica]|uniref:hypothetical protein n=1 Tax=Bisbaumannia pacifica TaxID=77098 RepID=UPI0023587E04|nr:hypothetical protein [Halomonas pacifica]MDC8804203.1 hypothetical protein [Halomonas pacifica]